MSDKNKVKIDSGTLLVSDPFMDDPNFKRSVVLLCEHHSEGSLGFILNKPLGMPVSSLLSGFPDFNAEVFYGGPVQTDTIHYVHNKGDLIEDSVEISQGVFWGGSYEQLKFCVQNELILPFDIKFFVGYSGWGEGQLVEEIEILSWMQIAIDKNYVFCTAEMSKNLWKTVLENEGDLKSVIAQMQMPNWN
jgi:putative transcriptional regulator